MFPKRKTKRQRLAAILAEIDTSMIRELPEEAEASTTSASTPGEITIIEDGTTMHGTGWVTPEDYIDDDVASGRLVSLKGVTPETLPGLEDEA